MSVWNAVKVRFSHLYQPLMIDLLRLVKAVELYRLRRTYRFQLDAVVLAVQYVPLHPCEQPYRGYAVR